MESKTNYTVVGVMVLFLILGLITAALWLSFGFDNKKYDIYTVYADEAVSGLSDDSVVKYNGVKVGLVDKIELNDIDPEEVKIQLKIVEGTPITIGTRATLINQGITGTTYLGLSSNSSTLLPLEKTPGEPYPVIPYKRSFLGRLEKNINDLSLSIKHIFDKQNARAFKNSLTNLETITHAIAKNDAQINESLEELPKLIRGLTVSVKKFNSMATSMSNAGHDVSTTMRTGTNTINKLSQQTLPPLTLLLQRLDHIAANLEKVSADMRQNPAVIIRGNTPPKSGPGE